VSLAQRAALAKKVAMEEVKRNSSGQRLRKVLGLVWLLIGRIGASALSVLIPKQPNNYFVMCVLSSMEKVA